MSVKAYLKGVEDGILKRIKENLDFAEANPYPADELKNLILQTRGESALAKVYGPTGELTKVSLLSPEQFKAAKDEADVIPGLWKRLQDGQKGIVKRKATETTLLSINPAEDLKKAYSTFYSTILEYQSSGSKITFDEVFKSPEDKFLDSLEIELDIELSLNSFGADNLVKAAFLELYEKDKGVKTGELGKSSINESATSVKPTEPAKTGGQPAASINSTTASSTPTNSATSNPINPTATKSSEPTSVTSLEGGVTSKTGELQKENILETDPSKAISINLENKPTESKPATGPTSNSTTATTTSNSTTVNDVNSTSSVTSNPSNTSTNTGVTGDKNIMKVENTTNQSSSSTVNEDKPKKEKGGFLSKVGNLAKKAGAALNLPSVGELGEQAKGLFGAAGANIGSRISEVKNSFSINSRDEESNSAPTSSTSTNSVNSSNTTTTTKPNDILAVPNTGTTSTTSDILKTETQTAMNVEQNKPAVTATSALAPVSNLPGTSASTAVSNTTNSQNTSSPATTTSNTSQNTQSAGQPAGSPAGVGVNVDMNQLAQSITRLERILISGIEVTIKDA